MRIIGGTFKGVKIFEAFDKNTRPLKDLVKESILNILEYSKDSRINLNNSLVLDLFSGTGSFGLECISRGATKVYLNSAGDSYLNGGDVGIGTTSPDYILNTEGTGTQRIAVDCTNNSTAGAYFRVYNSGSLVGNGTIATQNDGDMHFFTGTSSEALKMVIEAGGNVGIGTASPGAKLEVLADAAKGVLINILVIHQEKEDIL